ncbi:acyltransferase family protein [Sphingomonas sp. CFBP 8760]|uniref:acyltransferase family protein n=1 Tax=Sphingomonas sp. CFBP 8760 TaxID=2775282 RepID=UPI001FCE6790|nr:acyltransferase [Sphingomonas sp. CFBP 8760]
MTLYPSASSSPSTSSSGRVATGPADTAPAAVVDAMARGDNPEARKIEAYPALDWLRFVLASVVVLGHEGIAMPGPVNGGLAVEVFLALSGWLIGGILLRTTAAELPRFFYNRSTRIWAPYLATATLVYGLAAVRQGIDGNWFKYLFYDLTFTHYTFTTFPRALTEMPLGGTGAHFWSISVEEQFYLAAPIVMLFLGRGRSLVTWVLIAALLLVAQSQFAAIALGVAAAVAHRRYGFATGEPLRHALLGLLAVALFAVAWRWNVPPARALFACAAVVALTIPGARGRWGVLFGALSYPLYLNHWLGGFVMQAVDKLVVPLPDAVMKATSYLMAVVVAYVAWFVIDRQVMARRGGWYTPALGRASQVAAYTLFAIGIAGGTILWANGQ